MVRELLDVVYQAEELPLRIDLVSASQGKTIKPLVMADIGKYRFHGGKALPIAPATFCAVDAPSHPVGTRFGLVVLSGKEHHLAHRGALRVAQALVA
jgi:hypothetical protein